MTDTQGDGVTPSRRLDQWRALVDKSEPWHEVGCPVLERNVVDGCTCRYGMSVAFHAIAELHQPVTRARRVACAAHRLTPIWSELAHAPDTCVDCRLTVEVRCSQDEQYAWPCKTAQLALHGMHLADIDEVDRYLGRVAA